MKTNLLLMAALLPAVCAVMLGQTETRPRARDLGVEVGVLHAGPLNAITDVAGVKVGQTTLIRGDNIRTGVTAILPHGGNLYKERVPGAVFLGNA
jgi:D-aminopeptidase